MGAAPIPKSVTKSRIEENIEIFDFELTPEEMEDIQSIETGIRMSADFLSKFMNSEHYPFGIPF